MDSYQAAASGKTESLQEGGFRDMASGRAPEAEEKAPRVSTIAAIVLVIVSVVLDVLSIADALALEIPIADFVATFASGAIWAYLLYKGIPSTRPMVRWMAMYVVEWIPAVDWLPFYLIGAILIILADRNAVVAAAVKYVPSKAALKGQAAARAGSSRLMTRLESNKVFGEAGEKTREALEGRLAKARERIPGPVRSRPDGVSTVDGLPLPKNRQGGTTSLHGPSSNTSGTDKSTNAGLTQDEILFPEIYQYKRENLPQVSDLVEQEDPMLKRAQTFTSSGAPLSQGPQAPATTPQALSQQDEERLTRTRIGEAELALDNARQSRDPEAVAQAEQALSKLQAQSGSGTVKQQPTPEALRTSAPVSPPAMAPRPEALPIDLLTPTTPEPKPYFETPVTDLSKNLPLAANTPNTFAPAKPPVVQPPVAPTPLPTTQRATPPEAKPKPPLEAVAPVSTPPAQVPPPPTPVELIKPSPSQITTPPQTPTTTNSGVVTITQNTARDTRESAELVSQIRRTTGALPPQTPAVPQTPPVPGQFRPDIEPQRPPQNPR